MQIKSMSVYVISLICASAYIWLEFILRNLEEVEWKYVNMIYLGELEQTVSNIMHNYNIHNTYLQTKYINHIDVVCVCASMFITVQCIWRRVS